jgi:leucyl-tRNA synthetase
MRGYHVPRTWGWDCHGLPIETIAEKNLGLKDKSEIERTVGVAAFNAESIWTKPTEPSTAPLWNRSCGRSAKLTKRA